MTDADCFVEERDVEIDPLSREWLEGEEADATVWPFASSITCA